MGITAAELLELVAPPRKGARTVRLLQPQIPAKPNGRVYATNARAVKLLEPRRSQTPAQKRAKEKYRKANAARAKAQNRAWYEANREKAIERSKKWNREHPARRAVINRMSKRRRYKEDPVFRAKCQVDNREYRARRKAKLAEQGCGD